MNELQDAFLEIIKIRNHEELIQDYEYVSSLYKDYVKMDNLLSMVNKTMENDYKGSAHYKVSKEGNMVYRFELFNGVATYKELKKI